MPPKRRFSDDQELAICCDYGSGLSSGQVGMRWNAPHSTVANILKRHGVKTRRQRKLTEYQEDEACHLYEEGNSTRIIAIKMGVGSEIIRRLAHERGIIRGRGVRRYAVDETFFDSIDTEQKAYWLGFIAADGCIDLNSRLRISLAGRDRKHLERFLEDANSDYPIKDRMHDGNSSTVIQVWSPRLYTGLQAHGIKPAKSLTHRWPDFLAGDILRHYLRGYFDGDGSISVGRRQHQIVAYFFGTQAFLERCRTHLADACSLNPDIKLWRDKQILNGKQNKVWRLQYGGSGNLQRLGRYLYEGATIYLPRKRERVAHLL